MSAQPQDGPSTASISTLASPEVSMDALRAVALSTLKARRRKAPEPIFHRLPLPSRPAAGPSTDFLDYGSEEATLQSQSIVKSTTTEESLQFLDFSSSEDREEGEISEDELAQHSDSNEVKPPVDNAMIIRDASPAPSVTSSTAFPTPSISTGTRQISRSRSEEIFSTPSIVDSSMKEMIVIDENHVRPGLSMTINQFNAIKEIILDLLGWGVEPEYLVDMGLTREAIYYVFTELKLRLPGNLDTTGLLPFVPASVLTGRPSVSENRSSQPPVTATTPPLTNHTVQDLNDMEARRRQELLARKAVLASRRKKLVTIQASSGSATHTSPVTPQSATLESDTVPTEATKNQVTNTVDDFLNSMIGDKEDVLFLPKSQKEGAITIVSAESDVPARSSSMPMEVDSDAIPGFGMLLNQAQIVPESEPASDAPTPSRHNFSSRRSEDRDEGGSHPVDISMTATTSSSILVQTGPSLLQRPLSRVSTPVASGSATPRSPMANGHGNMRFRGTKRPVAADFVDSDTGSRLSRQGSFSTQVPAYIRRKTFAGLGSLMGRRCVIDLSDTEDEEEEPGGGGEDSDDGGGASSSGIVQIPRLIRPLPTSASSASKIAQSTLSPTALKAKEEEIKRMKEMIARREQERLRKLAVKSRTPVSSTPPPTTTSIQQTYTTSEEVIHESSVKQEELEHDSSMLSDPGPSAVKNTGHFPQAAKSEVDEVEEMVLSNDSEPPSESSDILSTGMGPKVIRHRSTGESVLTAEAEQEQVVPPEDDDDSFATVLNSSEDETNAQNHRYTSYHSPLFFYPLLRSHSRVISDLAYDSSHSFSMASTSKAVSSSISLNRPSIHSDILTMPDLQPLRIAVLVREAGSDSSRRICQYEIPGGGVCRDSSCPDLHIGDLEPSDAELAHYLLEAMPNELQAFSESEIVDKLLQTRQKRLAEQKIGGENMMFAISLEEIVSTAIGSLVGSAS